MKYALFLIESMAVVQWQDTDVYGYNEPQPPYARIELDDNDLPEGFDVNAQPSGWWVVDGALTQVAPPAPLSWLAATLIGQVSVRRYYGVVAGVVLPDSTVFAPSDSMLANRVLPLALGQALLAGPTFDIQIGPDWLHFTKQEIQDAFAALVDRREAFYSAESAHCEAINALLVANDRAGLEGYDVTAGWPT